MGLAMLQASTDTLRAIVMKPTAARLLGATDLVRPPAGDAGFNLRLPDPRLHLGGGAALTASSTRSKLAAQRPRHGDAGFEFRRQARLLGCDRRRHREGRQSQISWGARHGQAGVERVGRPIAPQVQAGKYAPHVAWTERGENGKTRSRSVRASRSAQPPGAARRDRVAGRVSVYCRHRQGTSFTAVARRTLTTRKCQPSSDGSETPRCHLRRRHPPRRRLKN